MPKIGPPQPSDAPKHRKRKGNRKPYAMEVKCSGAVARALGLDGRWVARGRYETRKQRDEAIRATRKEGRYECRPVDL